LDKSEASALGQWHTVTSQIWGQCLNFESDATLVVGYGTLLKMDIASALMNSIEIEGAYHLSPQKAPLRKFLAHKSNM